jgi:hypothetical protein
MAEKIINFGTCAPAAGDTVDWRGILDDDVLGAGDTTKFTVELTRPAADGALGDGGVTVFVLKIGPPTVTVDAPGPIVGIDTGNTLLAGETKKVSFYITNAPAGATPAAYFLVSVIVWGAHPPCFSLFTAP